MTAEGSSNASTDRMVSELKSVSHDLFNLLTVMYGLQETLQALPALAGADETLKRAAGDFDQLVGRMQQIGQRVLKLYRDESPK